MLGRQDDENRCPLNHTGLQRLSMKELSICVWKSGNKEVDRLLPRVLANFVFPLNRHKDFMVIRAPDQRQEFILDHP